MRILAIITMYFSIVSTAGSAEELWDGFRAPNDADYCVDVAEVRIAAGWWIDAVQIFCRDQGFVEELPYRGGNGGTLHRLTLRDDERVIGFKGGVGGPDGNHIYTLRVITDQGRSKQYGGDGGHSGDRHFEIIAQGGDQFVGLLTRSSDSLETIGLITERRRVLEPTPTPPAPRMSAPPLRCCGTTLGICVAGSDCKCC